MTSENAGRPGPRRLRADRARQVADVLRRQVLAEQGREHPLPHEEQLAEEFGESRNTVREALDLLRAEGLVRRVPGSGTVVVAAKVPHGLNRLEGLAETLHEHGEVVNEVRAFGPVRAPGPVARRFGLPDGADVVYVERLRRLNGLPLSLDLTYLAPDIGAGLDAADLAGQDLFRLIEEIAGQPLGRAEITLEAVNADPHSATVLEVPRGAALLMLERLTSLADGRPVDLEYVRFRGDRLTMQGHLLRDLP
ncbi:MULTISPECIES: GntR family transcriptional regulator [unclassified Kitasatospora]|uniref:GntR family transcriptional regulator n=1 Tax=unclassified Kitasatospora TaxID=2633591 RepID=UPI00070E47E0|nr:MULTISPECIES: GntR family transcriptional regulator [unclassified Kitasatospora]KQV18589.1 GntR family transcriptional regulator [Kitasatospora sp. Root107]KRB74571.1 GntR family transcriptional regulator [Kitasatospora sp. Root187]